MRAILFPSLAVFFLLVLPLATPGDTKPAPKKSTRTTPAAKQWQVGLTLRQKIAQLIVIPFSGEAPNTRIDLKTVTIEKRP